MNNYHLKKKEKEIINKLIKAQYKIVNLWKK